MHCGAVQSVIANRCNACLSIDAGVFMSKNNSAVVFGAMITLAHDIFSNVLANIFSSLTLLAVGFIAGRIRMKQK
jgi:hypothetical protein